jgi:hypothetical protein
MANFINSHFDSKTMEEFKNSECRWFGNKQKTSKPAGTRVLLQNIQTREVFAIAVLGAFENGKVYRKHCMMDVDIYSGDATKYNKYDICIEKIKFFDNPIPFVSLAILFGINNAHMNNITKKSNVSFGKLFYLGEDSEIILQRVNIWASTLGF